MPISARRFLRKMRGGAQSHLIEGSDGSHYVVKFLNNPQHRRVLINEWISGVFLKHLRIHAPDYCLIEVAPEFIARNREVHIVRGSRQEPPLPGLHFGSKLAVDSCRGATYDFLPDSLLAKVNNRRDFLGAVVFDKWVSNADSRQAVFFRGRPKTSALLKGDVRKSFWAQMIDHGSAFGGPRWEFSDAPASGIYFRSSVYQEVESIDSFQPWLDLVTHFPVELVHDAWKGIPSAWIDRDEEALEKLLEQLLSRRKGVQKLILQVKQNLPATFPNWA
jgi:hypothetical protein